MNTSDLIGSPSATTETAFSFELLPPLKGHSIQHVFNTIDRLRQFNPRYINITTHHGESIYRENNGGTFRKVNVRRRPGSVAIAAAIQNKYAIRTVPHVICTGFSKQEIEYSLIDLAFLGVTDLLLLRGDSKNLDAEQLSLDSHSHATDLQVQINNYNKGIALDGSAFEAPEKPFTYGMACYPEKHEESPNMESEIFYTKMKADNGADYLVTQMFFDNRKFFKFVDKCQQAGITAPIIPGIKPIHQKNQLTNLPRIFRTDIPEELAIELRKCKDEQAVKELGVEWCIHQCRELKAHNVLGIHFYAFMAAESVEKVAKEIY